jgi:hypothetical protein
MEHVILIKGLRDRASEIKGQIAVLEGHIAKERANLAHVEATIRLFDPAYDGKQVKPKRITASRSHYFRMGEITLRCREALRDATGPTSAAEIAEKAMRDKGLDVTDGKIRSDMIARLLWALHRLAKDGSVRRVGNGLGARWALPVEPEGEKRITPAV